MRVKISRIGERELMGIEDQHEYFQLVRERQDAFEAYKTMGEKAHPSDEYWVKYKASCIACDEWLEKRKYRQ